MIISTKNKTGEIDYLVDLIIIDFLHDSYYDPLNRLINRQTAFSNVSYLFQAIRYYDHSRG